MSPSSPSAASLRASSGDDALAQVLTALREEFAYADMRGARPVGSLSAELYEVIRTGAAEER